MKTFVIGDIHGGLKALPQILKKAKVTTEDTLIFLGDYVDGWSESAQVIDYLIDLNKTHNCIFIKGNHDVYCENWLRENISDKSWLFHGGEMTIKSYSNFDSEAKKQHLDFLERMKLYHIDTKNRLFIHAGFTSMHGPQQEVHQSNYNWDRTLWEMAISMDTRIKEDSIMYPKRLKLFKEIYIGHTATTKYNSTTPINAVNLWNVDTGAAFTGALTIMDIDTKEYWQSEPLKDLYPKEKGRN